jgi:peptidoglycan/xylan/chitin deacetylase (PgdA/CDA1 family)
MNPLTSTRGPVDSAGHEAPVGSAVILLYHRVTEPALDPQLLHVTPRHFEQHLEVLNREMLPISLGELGAGVITYTLPKRSVVITFDDGYEDNVLEAAPLLEQYDTPATVFVTSGYVGRDREYWWDELERILFGPPKLPASLDVDLDDAACRFALTDDGVSADECPADWNVTRSEDPTARHRLYRVLFDRLKVMTHERRDGALDELARQAGVDRTPRPSHRPMSTEQLCHLHEGGLVEIGAHTVTHPVLSTLPPAGQRREMIESKETLERITGAPVTALAYPFGTRHDYTKETVQIAEEVGYAAACANVRGLAGLASSPFELPRVLVRDWDGDTLLRTLTELGVLV